jgi:hypothetical protein
MPRSQVRWNRRRGAGPLPSRWRGARTTGVAAAVEDSLPERPHSLANEQRFCSDC